MTEQICTLDAGTVTIFVKFHRMYHCPCGCNIDLTVNPGAKSCLGCERPVKVDPDDDEADESIIVEVP